MKSLFLVAACLVAIFSGQNASAQADVNNVSQSWGQQRGFNTSRTATSLNCTIMTTSSCPTPPSCYRYLRQGYNPSDKACCTLNYICRDGEVAQDLVEQVDQAEAQAQSNLEEVFTSDGRPEAYWGYVTTTNKSPNAGRAQSIDARIDACMGHDAVDTFVASSSDPMTQWSNCQSTCNTSANGNCTANSNQVCLDRCNCKYNGSYGTCSNL